MSNTEALVDTLIVQMAQFSSRLARLEQQQQQPGPVMKIQFAPDRWITAVRIGHRVTLTMTSVDMEITEVLTLDQFRQLARVCDA